MKPVTQYSTAIITLIGTGYRLFFFIGGLFMDKSDCRCEKMTIKELADVAGVSAETIRRTVNELYPEKLSQGVTTFFNQEESVRVLERVKKQNCVQLPQNEGVLTQCEEVVVIGNQMAELITGMLVKMLEPVYNKVSVLESQVKQLPDLTSGLNEVGISIRKQIHRNVTTYGEIMYKSLPEGQRFKVAYRDFYGALWDSEKNIEIWDLANSDGLKPMEFIEQKMEKSLQEYCLKVSEYLLQRVLKNSL